VSVNDRMIALWEAGATVPEIVRDLRTPRYLVYRILLAAEMRRPPPVSQPLSRGESWRKAEMVEALLRGERFTSQEAMRRFGYASLKNVVQALETVAVKCEDGRWRHSTRDPTRGP
jgi:hypothetical protein